MIDKKWSEQGFIDEPIPANIDVKTEIKRMCKEKNAVIIDRKSTRLNSSH